MQTGHRAVADILCLWLSDGGRAVGQIKLGADNVADDFLRFAIAAGTFEPNAAARATDEVEQGGVLVKL